MWGLMFYGSMCNCFSLIFVDTVYRNCSYFPVSGLGFHACIEATSFFNSQWEYLNS